MGSVLASKMRWWLVLSALAALVDPGRPQGLGATSAVARCDFELTRQAREILQRELFTPLEAMNYMVSERCPIHPAKDMLQPFEEHKKMIRKRKWECKICHKQFESEKFLDKHFVNRHEQSHTDLSRSMCLGSVCDILHCPATVNDKVTKCNKKSLQKRQMFCQKLLHRCLAFDAAGHKHETDEAHSHHELQHDLEHLELQLRHKFCDPLHCESTLVQDAKEAAMWQNLFILASVLVTVGLMVYYIVLWLTHTKSSGVQDLRRRRAPVKSPMQRIKAYFSSKAKTY